MPITQYIKVFATLVPMGIVAVLTTLAVANGFGVLFPFLNTDISHIAYFVCYWIGVAVVCVTCMYPHITRKHSYGRGRRFKQRRQLS